MSLNENDNNHTRELRKCTVIIRKQKKKKLLERMHPVQMALLMLKDMEIKQIIF